MGVLETTKGKRGKSTLLLIIVITFVLGVVYFWVYKHQNWFVIEKTYSTITLNSSTLTLSEKETSHIFVIKNNKDGSKENVTVHSDFSTSNTSVATVDNNGVISSVNSGFAKIKVRYEGITKQIEVTVTSSIAQVNVKDYGAVGDGIVNDTTAFQDAIDDLSKKGGGNIFVPKGIYSVHSIFLKPKVNIIGENREVVTLKLADDAPDGQNRVINMNDHTKVQNITCDGNYQKHPNGIEHMHCIFAFDKENILIDNNKLKNAIGDGISISGSTKASNYVVISNNIIEENQRSQIVIEQVNHLKIFNNKITSLTGRPGIHFEPWEKMQYFDAKIFKNTIITNTDGYAVLLTGAEFDVTGKGGTGYYYHDIEFYQNTVNSPYGLIRIIDTSGANVHDNKLNVKYVHIWRKNKNTKISSNSINGEIGVLIEGGWDGNLLSSGTEIENNQFSTLKEGVLIQDGAEKVNIHQNSFYGSSDKSGVKLLASEDINEITLSDNTFSLYSNGVYFDYVSNSDKLIKEVLILNNRFIDLVENALFIQGTVHKVVFDSNVVERSSGAFIYVHKGRPMSSIAITNNIISGGKKGINLEEYGRGSLDSLKIEGNHISDTTDIGDGQSTGAAIELDQFATPPTNVSISDNVLTNNKRNFITVPDSLLTSLKNNSLLKNDRRR